MKRALLLTALGLVGCGSSAPDLFEVHRSGADRAANLTMVVNDGGSVSCNGREHELPPKQLLRARELTRALGDSAELGLDLPPAPGSVLSYRVRLQAGTIAFADNSRHLPRPLIQLEQFTKDVSENVCGVRRP